MINLIHRNMLNHTHAGKSSIRASITSFSFAIADALAILRFISADFCHCSLAADNMTGPVKMMNICTYD